VIALTDWDEKDYSAQFDRTLWIRLLRYAKPFYKHFAIIVALMGVTAGIDAVFPLMTRYAMDVFIPNGISEGFAPFVLMYAGLLTVQGASIYTFIRVCGKVEMGMCYRIRKLGFERLQELPFAYYDKTPVGYIMTRMTSDAQRLADTIAWSLLDLCWGAFYLIGTATAMFVLNARLAATIMCVLPPLAAISWFFQKKILKSYREVRKTNSKITGAFNEGIMGAKTTKTLVREEANFEEFAGLTRTMQKSSVRAATLSAIYLPIVVSLSSLAMAYALHRGGVSVMTGGMTLGTLKVFVAYTVSFFEPVHQVARILAGLQAAQAAAERVMTLIETEPEIKDTPEVTALFGDRTAAEASAAKIAALGEDIMVYVGHGEPIKNRRKW